jgi:chemotaxis methyl-accepting protein methylase
VVSDRVRRLVRVRRVDLLLEPPPGSGYDLVLCRNVVIYFDRPTQERLFALFARALAEAGSRTRQSGNLLGRAGTGSRL